MSEELKHMQTTVNLFGMEEDARRKPDSWYEAMAEAWGEALDQAGRRKIQSQAESVQHRSGLAGRRSPR